MREKIYRRIVEPLLSLPRQGLSPERLALSVAVGIALGVFPVLGTTTLLCGLAAILFRLNVPAMQLVNYLVFSLQLALLIPFIRLGELLYGADPALLTLGQIQNMLRHDPGQAIATLAGSLVHATTAWFLIAPFAIYATYRLLTPLFRRLEGWHQAVFATHRTTRNAI